MKKRIVCLLCALWMAASLVLHVVAEEKNVTKLLNLEDKHVPFNLIFIGHPQEEPEGRDQYEEECVHYVR